MSESLLREIAEQIVREQILTNWRFYLALFTVSMLAAVGSAFLAAYVRKRAETYATKTDLQELIEQLKATTLAAEQVKTAIAHTDWSNREWKSLRRTKLEDLFLAVYDLRHWLDKDMNIRFFNEAKSEEKPPVWRLELLSRLYFPELLDESLALSLIYTKYTQWMLEVQGQLFEAGKDLAKRKIVFDGCKDGLAKHHQALLDAISAFEKKAPSVMKAIVGV